MAVTASVTIPSFYNVAASLVLQDLTYTAKAPGQQGNSITIAYIDPGMAGAISVAVVGTAISVTLASDGMAVTSTATQVKAAIDGNAGASALVSVSISGTGSNVQSAVGATPLASGQNKIPYNSKVMAMVTISNGGGVDVTLKDLRPITGNGAVALGQWGPPIGPVTVPASGSIVEPFAIIPFMPQIAGGSSLTPVTYSIGCNLIMSDGQSVAATAANLTVTPNSL